MTDWQLLRLGDALSVSHGFAFKGEFFCEYGDLIVLTPGNFRDEGGFKPKGGKEKFYEGPFPKRFLLKKSQVVVAMTEQSMGLLGSSATIPTNDKYLHNQRIGLLNITDPCRLDLRFAYHLLNASFVRQQIQATATGSKVRHTAPNRIEAIVAPVPDIECQRRIARALDDVDNLIENNRQRIEVLEEMARLLYREWFVHFRFPGHEDVGMVDSDLGPIPEGWAWRNLFDLAEVGFGFSFKSKRFGESGTFRVIRIRDVPKNTTRTFTDENAGERYEVQDGDTLIGMDGDFHMCRWADGLAYLNQRVARLRTKGQLSQLHLHLALEQPIRRFNETIIGTTVAHLGKRHLEEIYIAEPPLPLLAAATHHFQPTFELELNLRKQNRALREARDLLLPRLVSGELDVSELDVGLEAGGA